MEAFERGPRKLKSALAAFTDSFWLLYDLFSSPVVSVMV